MSSPLGKTLQPNMENQIKWEIKMGKSHPYQRHTRNLCSQIYCCFNAASQRKSNQKY